MTMTMDVGTTNDTDAPPPSPHYVDELKLPNRVVLTTLLVVIEIGMGCVISGKAIKTTFRRPVGVFVGFMCQFVLMPLLTFLLAHALQIKAAFAIGMLIVGCSPGGDVSNLFTYWSNGDATLSVIMTTASVIFSFGMMPLNLFIYSRSWTDKKSVIPYKDIMITLVSIAFPVLLGMLIRYKKKQWAPNVAKFAGFMGMFCKTTAIILNGFINPRMFTSGWKVWIAGVLLPFVGFGIGYGIARLLKQTHAQCRTIAFETGCQNVALALTIILLTFSDHPDFNDLITYPSIFAIFMNVDALICVGICCLVMSYKSKNKLSQDKKREGVEIEKLENMI